MTGDLPTHHAGVPPDPRRDHHTLDALGDPPGDLLPVRPGHHDPTSGFGAGSGGDGGQRTGAALPPPGRLRRRTRRLLRRRPGPASLRSPCQPPPRAGQPRPARSGARRPRPTPPTPRPRRPRSLPPALLVDTPSPTIMHDQLLRPVGIKGFFDWKRREMSTTARRRAELT